MRSWHLTGLVVSAAALLFTARPAQAQVWVGRPAVVSPPPAVWYGPPAPVVVARPPVVVSPAPVVVARPAVAVPVNWGARPGEVRRANRRAYRAARRAGW